MTTGSCPFRRRSTAHHRPDVGEGASAQDLAGDGDHYAALVVSNAFTGKTRVQQHQMVYQALEGRMGGELHALALQTSVPKDN